MSKRWSTASSIEPTPSCHGRNAGRFEARQRPGFERHAAHGREPILAQVERLHGAHTPLLAKRGLTWADVQPVLERIESVGEIRKAMNECFYSLIHETHKFNGAAENLRKWAPTAEN